MTAGAVEYLAETYGGDARSSVFLGGIIALFHPMFCSVVWLRFRNTPPPISRTPPGPTPTSTRCHSSWPHSPNLGSTEVIRCLSE